MAQGRPKQTNYFEKLDKEVRSNQSRLSMVLGALIILVVGILVFNYFSRGRETLGPAQQIQPEEGDVSPQNLPGKYTVKENDTLFLIAEKYYKDGYKYPEITKANSLTNADAIEVGQVLEIPKLAEEVAAAAPSPSPDATPLPTEEPLGTGGADTTIWGPRIREDTYTVVEDDWLSKIAGRAYGDIFAYKKLAEVNNIPNPDLIFPGQVIKIPR